MKIKINKNQYSYIRECFFEKQQNIIFKLNVENSKYYILLDINNANLIRDYFMNRQILLGFDINYDLTFEGKILQELIDLFYIDD